jgi:hypothetical protein
MLSGQGEIMLVTGIEPWSHGAFRFLTPRLIRLTLPTPRLIRLTLPTPYVYIVYEAFYRLILTLSFVYNDAGVLNCS